MIETINPLKYLPDNITLDGDYYTTQTALILGVLADDGVIIRNYNRGIDTSHTASFLAALGCRVTISDDCIVVQKGEPNESDDWVELKYDGGTAPLIMIIGLLAGKNRPCRLCYSRYINPDGIDNIIALLNRFSIDIDHYDPAHHNLDTEAGGVLIFRESRIKPIECRLDSAYAHAKNCLLTLGLVSGCSIAFREDLLTPDYVKKMIVQLGGQIEVTEAKQIWTTDPDDPRKRIKVNDIDCAREERLPASSKLIGGEVDVPGDFSGVAALSTLAVLGGISITIEKALLNRGMMKLLNYLKSSGADFSIKEKVIINGRVIGTVTIDGAKLKGRKIFGRQAAGLIDSTPFLAVMAALSDGTTILRDIEEYAEFNQSAFTEMANNLNRMDIKTGVLEDGIVIENARELSGADFGPFVNRETALAFYMVALAGVGRSFMIDFERVLDNYPNLTDTLRSHSERKEIYS